MAKEGNETTSKKCKAKKTDRLVDTLAKEDKETGKTTIEIPVADKESVTRMFRLFGKLINLGK